MDDAKLRGWWFARQGLDGSMQGLSSAEVLSKVGWARSVGGSNPYLTLFSRAGISMKQADEDAKAKRIYELPSARGCTYVLPEEDFALGLKAGEKFGGTTEIATAKKLGVADSEIAALCDKAYEALAKETLDPKALKDRVGDAVRNLGDEGKKRGLQTTLPLALGLLQKNGRIVRIPVNGRFDSQRYAYSAWTDNPVAGFKLSQEEVFVELAKRFWRWIGPATMDEFKWFTALGVGACKAAVEPLGLVPIEEGSNLLCLPEDRGAIESFKAGSQPQYALISSIDSLVLLRRSLASHVDPSDSNREAFAERGLRRVGDLQDLPSNGIFDRGLLIGLWEYDPTEQKIVAQIWHESADSLSRGLVSRDKAPAALRAKIDEMEAYVRDQLGDARSFSLDSPESRKPLLAALKG